MPRPDAILIAGPTASGKSALALALADALGGVVINADSMQVYRDLRVITARPTPQDEAHVPHRLYGHVDAAENYSVGRWLGDVRPVLDEVREAGRVPILVGGTGLYFKVLTQGLSAVPPTPAEVRASVRARLDAEGTAAVHAELLRRDPSTQVRPGDRMRIARALEVIEATGRSLAEWHRAGLPRTLDPSRAVTVFLAPERDELRARIDARFDAMLSAGALDEVRALAARKLDPLLPAMKAHGVPWLIRHLSARSRWTKRPRAPRTTRGVTPSASSPGCGINCRTGPGSRRPRRATRSCAPSRAEGAATTGTTRA